MLAGTRHNLTRFGVLPFFGAAASLAVCFSKVFIAILAPFLSIAEFEMNPHLQAVVMWLFAAIAVIGLVSNRKQHGSDIPFSVGVFGLAVIIGTLYTYYNSVILMFGYVALLCAAFLNQTQMLTVLNRTVVAQADDLARLNASLEGRVTEQVNEIERLAKLKRFLPGEVADLITSEGKEALLDSHRRYIACLFCDIRRFTAMTETLEPEDVMEVLRTFHERTGKLVARYRGTIGYRAGDGVMVVFNDPIACDDPDFRAVRLALDIQRDFDDIRQSWERIGVDIGVGIGIASGYATMGVVGVEGRSDYTAIGKAVNLASRLSDHAHDGEILISRRCHAAVDDLVRSEPIGEVALKGLPRPTAVFRVHGIAETGAVATLKSYGAADFS